MSWPAQLPDLNPIENLWDLIEMKVHKLNPRNFQDLWTAVQTAWDALPQDRLRLSLRVCQGGAKPLLRPKEWLHDTELAYIFTYIMCVNIITI